MKIHKILSENSDTHWKYIDSSDKVVLDLGCGRHATPDLKDTSPYWLSNQGAIKVYGVDANQGEVNFYNGHNLDPNKYQFICEGIGTTEQVRRLILNNNITCIKCDIEEYERVFYGITKEDLENVVEFAVEYHTYDIRNNLITKFDEWGFEIHTEGKFDFVDADHMGVLFASKL